MGHYAAVESTMKPSSIPARYLTHLSYAFAQLSVEGEVVTLPGEYGDSTALIINGTSAKCTGKATGNMDELWQLRQSNPHLRTLLAIGGWGERKSGPFRQATATAENIERFTKSAIRLMINYGFDGLDVDWEYPSGSGDTEQLLRLLQSLRQALRSVGDGKKYLLTVCGPIQAGLVRYYPLMEISKIVDWVNVMSYDYSADSTTQTAHDAPLFASRLYPPPDGQSINATIQAYLSQGIPARQLILGIPAFGYLFTKVPQGNRLNSARSPGVADHISYQKILAARSSSSYQQFFDETAMASWMYNPTKKELITYTDYQRDLPARLEFVRQRQLGGVMIWSVDQDSNPVTGPSIVSSVSTSMFGPSFITSNDGYLTESPPYFKAFPVCAPMSGLCNIQSKCNSFDFTGADDLSNGISIRQYIAPLMILTSLFLLQLLGQ